MTLKNLKNKSGAALLTVLVAMMIISIMLFEFQHMAMVERKLAYNELNQIQAYYLAKSGIRMALVRLAMFGRIRKAPQLTEIRKNLPNIDMYLDQIWQMPLPAFPPDSSKVKTLDANDKSNAEALLKQTKVSEGKSFHVISSESSKINLNALIMPQNNTNTRVSFSGPPQGPFHFTGLMLINLFEDFIRQSDNPNEEFPDLRPEEMVFNIMDWVNPGTQSVGGGTKDIYYEQQKPPYKSKKGKFYSLEELRLVKGMTEHLYQKMKPYVTVYASQGKININNISNQMLKLLHRDITDDSVKRINEEKGRRGGYWPDISSFITFISDSVGIANFKTTYTTPDDYFTTGNFNFIVESQGTVDKIQSVIVKTIRAAVSLAKPKGGSPDPSIRDPNMCRNAGKFWHAPSSTCMNLATNADECKGMAGQWAKNPNPPSTDPNQMCCFVQQMNAPAVPACPVKTAAGDPKAEPGTLKILYWSET